VHVLLLLASYENIPVMWPERRGRWGALASLQKAAALVMLVLLGGAAGANETALVGSGPVAVTSGLMTIGEMGIHIWKAGECSRLLEAAALSCLEMSSCPAHGGEEEIGGRNSSSRRLVQDSLPHNATGACCEVIKGLLDAGCTCGVDCDEPCWPAIRALEAEGICEGVLGPELSTSCEEPTPPGLLPGVSPEWCFSHMSEEQALCLDAFATDEAYVKLACCISAYSFVVSGCACIPQCMGSSEEGGECWYMLTVMSFPSNCPSIGVPLPAPDPVACGAALPPTSPEVPITGAPTPGIVQPIPARCLDLYEQYKKCLKERENSDTAGITACCSGIAQFVLAGCHCEDFCQGDSEDICVPELLDLHDSHVCDLLGVSLPNPRQCEGALTPTPPAANSQLGNVCIGIAKSDPHLLRVTSGVLLALKHIDEVDCALVEGCQDLIATTAGPLRLLPRIMVEVPGISRSTSGDIEAALACAEGDAKLMMLGYGGTESRALGAFVDAIKGILVTGGLSESRQGSLNQIRTIPDLSMYGSVIVDLFVEFGWECASIMASEDDEAQNNELLDQLRRGGISVFIHYARDWSREHNCGIIISLLPISSSLEFSGHKNDVWIWPLSTHVGVQRAISLVPADVVADVFKGHLFLDFTSNDVGNNGKLASALKDISWNDVEALAPGVFEPSQWEDIIQLDPNLTVSTDTFKYWYDAVWTAAAGIASSRRFLGRAESAPQAADLLMDLRSVEFSGATGAVAFTASGNRDPRSVSVELLSVGGAGEEGATFSDTLRAKDGVKVAARSGTWKYTPGDGSSWKIGTVFWADGSTYPEYTPSDQLERVDPVDKEEERLETWVVIVLSVAMPIALICVAGCGIWLFRRRLDEAITKKAGVALKMGGAPTEGQMVTLVITDIQGSTTLWDRYPDAMSIALPMHHECLRGSLKEFYGHEVTTEGDSFQVAFHDPVDAVAWCCHVQQALMQLHWPAELQDGGEGLREISSNAHWCKPTPSALDAMNHLTDAIPESLQKRLHDKILYGEEDNEPTGFVKMAAQSFSFANREKATSIGLSGRSTGAMLAFGGMEAARPGRSLKSTFSTLQSIGSMSPAVESPADDPGIAEGSSLRQPSLPVTGTVSDNPEMSLRSQSVCGDGRELKAGNVPFPTLQETEVDANANVRLPFGGHGPGAGRWSSSRPARVSMDMIGSFGSFSASRFSTGNIGNIGNIEGEPLWTTAFRRGGLVKGTQGALFKGLRVRMGIHTGPVPRGYGQQPDGSLVYGGRVLRDAKHVADSPAGGQIVMSGTVLGSMNVEELRDVVSEKDHYSSAEIARGLLIIHLGEHQMTRESADKTYLRGHSSLVSSVGSDELFPRRGGNTPENFRSRASDPATAFATAAPTVPMAASTTGAAQLRRVSMGSLNIMDNGSETSPTGPPTAPKSSLEAARERITMVSSNSGNSWKYSAQADATPPRADDGTHASLTYPSDGAGSGRAFTRHRRSTAGSDIEITGSAMDIITAVPGALQLRAAFYPAIKTEAKISQGYFEAPHKDNMTVNFTYLDSSWSTLMEWCPDAYEDMMEMHRLIIRESLSEHRGYEVHETQGNFLTAFNDPSDLVRWMLDVQTRFLEADWGEEVLSHPMGGLEYVGGLLVHCGPRLRMGATRGSAIKMRPCLRTGRAEYFGPNMNHAARIAQASHGGQILVCSNILDEIPEDIREEIGLQVIDHGSHTLKGVKTSVHIYQLADSRLAARPFPPINTAGAVGSQGDSRRLRRSSSEGEANANVKRSISVNHHGEIQFVEDDADDAETRAPGAAPGPGPRASNSVSNASRPSRSATPRGGDTGDGAWAAAVVPEAPDDKEINDMEQWSTFYFQPDQPSRPSLSSRRRSAAGSSRRVGGRKRRNTDGDMDDSVVPYFLRDSIRAGDPIVRKFGSGSNTTPNGPWDDDDADTLGGSVDSIIGDSTAGGSVYNKFSSFRKRMAKGVGRGLMKGKNEGEGEGTSGLASAAAAAKAVLERTYSSGVDSSWAERFFGTGRRVDVDDLEEGGSPSSSRGGSFNAKAATNHLVYEQDSVSRRQGVDSSARPGGIFTGLSRNLSRLNPMGTGSDTSPRSPRSLSRAGSLKKGGGMRLALLSGASGRLLERFTPDRSTLATAPPSSTPNANSRTAQPQSPSRRSTMDDFDAQVAEVHDTLAMGGITIKVIGSSKGSGGDLRSLAGSGGREGSTPRSKESRCAFFLRKRVSDFRGSIPPNNEMKLKI